MSTFYSEETTGTGPPTKPDAVSQLIDRHIPWAIHAGGFSHQFLGAGAVAEQGWKLHLSATPDSAVAVLAAALDILLAEAVRFKVACSMDQLFALNAGELGISQIGKFITVYPSDDTQAVQLADLLDEATRNQRGPRIPSDRRLRPGSLVHYRYGSMHPRSDVLADESNGTALYDLLDADGRLTQDSRPNFYLPPPGIRDPFEAAGLFVAAPERPPLLNGRYLIIDALGQSPRGGVYRAVDLGDRPATVCLLKEYWHDVCSDRFGRDGHAWADNERMILNLLLDEPTVPRFLEGFYAAGNHYNAIEYVGGFPLDELVDARYPSTLSLAEAVEIALTTGDQLAQLHSRNIVYRDFKPANIVKTQSGNYRLVDFAIAFHGDEPRPALGIGTPEFCSPEQFRGYHPQPGDDVFAWGAVLHQLVCGPTGFQRVLSGMGDVDQPYPRPPVRAIDPDLPEGLAGVIDRALAWDATERFPTMRQAWHALDAATRSAQKRFPKAPMKLSPSGHPAAPLGRDNALVHACAAGDALCEQAEQRGSGLCWPTARQLRGPELYSGAAGVGLFLAELAHVTGRERYAAAARGAARWLAGPTWARGWAQHGLHGGEPGVAYFFLRLASLLDEPGYTTAAEFRMRRLRGAAAITEDLMYGTAGTIVATLRLHAATGNADHLDAACIAGDELVNAARPGPGPRGGWYWDVGAPELGGPSRPYLGLLHGAAGIGLALTELAAATGKQRYRDIAAGVGELLLSEALPAHPMPFAPAETSCPGGGARWAWRRRLADDQPGLQAHCHGAGGIGQFFLRLYQLTPDERYAEAARAAARTVADRQDQESQLGACHGLSATGNVLLDCYRILGEQEWLVAAQRCGRRLVQLTAVDHPRGVQPTAADSPALDLMVGYAGVAAFLLRLHDPANRGEIVLG